MQLFHGSSVIIRQPEYGKGNIHNDYGQGFYCTRDIDLAKEWACPHAENGIVNCYDIDMSGLHVMNLQSEEFHILNWMALLLENRVFVKRTPVAKAAHTYLLQEFLPETDGYDVICGYRADDSYFAYARDFLNNTISVNQLMDAMKLGKLGTQVMLKSEKAVAKIQFRGYDMVDAGVYYPKRMTREQTAREVYLQGQAKKFSMDTDALFVVDLMRRGVKNDDACLR